MEEYRHDLAFRVYVTDSFRALTGATNRYADIFAPEETRTAEEIIVSINEGLRRLGEKE